MYLESMILSDFEILRPPHETNQEATLHWLVEAHVASEKSQDPAFRAALTEKLWRVGCKPDRIAKRGHIVQDYLHQDYTQM